MRRRVERWGVGLLGTLALLGMGLLYTNPTLVTAALIPLGYLIYGSLSGAPSDAELSASRTIRPSTPEPGEAVRVTLEVRNDGGSVLPDLRVIDGVPAELAVTDGSARLSHPLSPGETAETTYTVVANRGEFAFDDPAVRIRSLAGSERETRTVAADGDSGFSCTNTAGSSPIQESSIVRQGTFPVDDGGSGQEFYATRQYKRGDPMNRIDWRHVAKTGEFITIQYRKERVARTVIVVDARPVNRVTPAPGYPTGVQLSTYAAERLFDAMESAGVAATVAAVGVGSAELDGLVGPDGIAWVDPRQDTGRQSRAGLLFERLQTEGNREVAPLTLSVPEELLTGRLDSTPDAAVGGSPVERRDGTALGARGREPPTGQRGGAGARADGGGGTRSGGVENDDLDDDIHRLLTRIPADAQVVLCSPLVDNWPVTLASALSVRGHSVVTLTPDVTSSGTPGQRLAGISRRARLRTIERLGAETVDWSVDSPIDRAVRLSLPHLVTQQ